MADGVNSRILTAYGKHPLFTSFKSWLSRHDVDASFEMVVRPSGDNAALWLAPKNGFRDVLLFLHGMGNDHLYAHFDLFTALMDNGIAVLSVDLDGHGSLSRSTLDATTLADLAPHAWALLKGLAPTARPHLAGYSLGAALSLHAAAALNPTTLALVAYPLGHPRTWSFLTREAITLAHPIFMAAMARHGIRAVWPALGAFGRDRYPVRLASETWRWAYVEEVGRFLGGVDPHLLAGNLTMSTLWLAGRCDALCPVTLLDELTQKTPRGRSMKLTGAGHLTTLFHKDLGPALTAHVLS